MLLFLFSFTNQNLSLCESFGFDKPSCNVFISFEIFQEIYQPISFLFGILIVFMTRMFEFQADGFAKEMNYGNQLATGLTRLVKTNKSNMVVDELYATFNHSHPSLP